MTSRDIVRLPSRCSMLASALLLGSLLAPNAFASDTLVRYQVDFSQSHAHYIQVEVSVDDLPAGETEFYMPVWTPGSYLVREYARHVDSVTAVDGDGENTTVVKTSKNRWRVSLDKPGAITLRYRVYCNELSVRTNFVDSSFGILSGAATFMTIPERSEQPHQIELKLRDDWQHSVSAMPRSEQSAHTFVAQDFDELVDSPILVGNPTLHPFEVGGVTHYLVNQGGDGLWQGEKAAADAAKVVLKHQEMWGIVPYDRYYFLNVIAESGGGLEHDNSTVLMSSRWSFRNERSYRRWLSLVSHEFFHTWNVRRLRPKALIAYDYETENYFDELWVAEGITSYYDDLTVARAGLMKPQEYLAALSRSIDTVASSPGNQVQSLQQSSHDTWVKFYRPDENSRNTRISYYTKGAVVGFLLDAKIRQLTEDKHSLDDVMRQLYRDHVESGYTNADIQRIASEVAGADLSEWFQQHVFEATSVDTEPALEWLGLKLRNTKPAEQNQDAAEASGEAKPAAAASSPDESNGTPWIGLSSSTENGRQMVSGITEGSPAFDAGVNVDDELIALNGFRVTSSLTDRLRQYSVGENVKLLVSRRGKLHEIDVQLRSKPESVGPLQRVPKPTQQQKLSYEKWLHLKSS